MLQKLLTVHQKQQLVQHQHILAQLPHQQLAPPLKLVQHQLRDVYHQQLEQLVIDK